MPEFKPNVPVVQKDPLVSVDIKQANPLPAGKYRFQLVVVDDGNNESDPAFLDVIIRDTERPTAVLDMVDANARDPKRLARTLREASDIVYNMINLDKPVRARKVGNEFVG